MKRAIRWTSNTLVAMSLLLCGATAALWARSYWYGDITTHGYSATRPGGWCVDSWCGHLMWVHNNLRDENEWLNTRALTGPQRDNRGFNRTWLNRLGFVYLTEAYPPMPDDHFLGYTPPPIIRYQYIRVPHWFVMLLLGIAPAARLRAAVPRSRRDGLCAFCGYDLRATPDRCPECGGVPAMRAIT